MEASFWLPALRERETIITSVHEQLINNSRQHFAIPGHPEQEKEDPYTSPPSPTILLRFLGLQVQDRGLFCYSVLCWHTSSDHNPSSFSSVPTWTANITWQWISFFHYCLFVVRGFFLDVFWTRMSIMYSNTRILIVSILCCVQICVRSVDTDIYRDTVRRSGSMIMYLYRLWFTFVRW